MGVRMSSQRATQKRGRSSSKSAGAKRGSSRPRKESQSEQAAKLAAIDRVQAVIEFAMDGTILHANKNFLDAMGYQLHEIEGKHHSIFVDPHYARSREYEEFWRRLNDGQFELAEYKRLGKGGREVWIHASYNPIMDKRGKPFKVVKYATDVTQQKLNNANFSGQIESIGKAQAVIEFAMDGTILAANDNFLKLMGYTLDELRGQHHRMFVEPVHAAAPEYRQFWAELAGGRPQTGRFRRLGK